MGGYKGAETLQLLNSALFVDWYFSWPMYPFEGDNTGQEIVEWYHQLFQNATTFASILASVMFSAMVLDLNTAPPQHSSTSQMRTWSAIGAILFVILVLLCQGFSLILKFHGTEFEIFYDCKDLATRLLFAIVSLGFQGLLLTGTLFFCLVVKAYVPGAGWTAFGITSAFLLLSLLLWLRGVTWELWSQIRLKNAKWQVDVASVEAEVREAKQQESRAGMHNDKSDAGERAVQEAQAILRRKENKLARAISAQAELNKIRARSKLLKEGSKSVVERTAEDSVKKSEKGLDRQRAESQSLAAGIAAPGHPTPAPHQSSAPATVTRRLAHSEKGDGPDLSNSATQRPPLASPRGGKNAIGEGDIV